MDEFTFGGIYLFIYNIYLFISEGFIMNVCVFNRWHCHHCVYLRTCPHKAPCNELCNLELVFKDRYNHTRKGKSLLPHVSYCILICKNNDNGISVALCTVLLSCWSGKWHSCHLQCWKMCILPKQSGTIFKWPSLQYLLFWGGGWKLLIIILIIII